MINMKTVATFLVMILLLSGLSGLVSGHQESPRHTAKSYDNINGCLGVTDFAPILYYDYKEKYFPVDVHGDDYNVTNNHENYENNRFPSTPICYYNIVSYDGFRVYEYWFYYAYNDYNYYSIKINDVHEHDFESVFIWVNSSSQQVSYIATSMHLWMHRYSICSNHPVVYVERGGHGMSLDKKLIDGIPMVFDKVGKIISYNQFKFEDFSNLKKHAKDDLDRKGCYKTDEKSTVHVKAPWLRNVFNDPDVVRRSKSKEHVNTNEPSNLPLKHYNPIFDKMNNAGGFSYIILKKSFSPSSFVISKFHRLEIRRSPLLKVRLGSVLLV